MRRTPNYHNGGLTLLRVDTPEQVGRYQNVRLELEAGGNWRLAGVDELGAGRVARVPPETIEVVPTDSFPASVYNNRYTDDCNAISEYCQLPDGTRYY